MIRKTFKQKFTCLVKALSSRILTCYVIIFALLFFTVNSEIVKLERMNVLLDSANYPLYFMNHGREFNEKELRFAKKYYQALAAAVPSFGKQDLTNSSTTLSRSYAMIALCDYYLGNTKDALFYYEKALEQEPRHFWLYYNLGLVHFKREEFDQSLEYFKKSYSLTLADLDKSLDLDYVNLWPPNYAQKYQTRSLATFHAVINNSYKLSILALEKINDLPKAKALALRALWIEIDYKNDFFKYYAGLSTLKPVVSLDNFPLMYNPSLNFVKIGHETIFVEKHLGKIKMQSK